MSATTSRRRLFGGTVAASLAALLPAAASATTHPDAALLDLGTQLKAAWAVQDAYFAANPYPATDDECNAAMEPCLDLVDQIEEIQARTLDGVRVKAFAVWWCSAEGSSPFELSELVDDTDTTDTRIAGSIVRDLLAMGAMR